MGVSFGCQLLFLHGLEAGIYNFDYCFHFDRLFCRFKDGPRGVKDKKAEILGFQPFLFLPTPACGTGPSGALWHLI